MTVKEAIGNLAYGERYFLKGARTGKILHHSARNKQSNLDKYLDLDVVEDCYFADLYTQNRKYGTPFTYPIIGIWVSGM